MCILQCVYIAAGEPRSRRVGKKKSNLTRPGEMVDLSIANDNKKIKKKTPTTENRKRPDNNRDDK